MNFRKIIYFASVALTMSACVSTIPEKKNIDPPTVSVPVSVEYDEFRKVSAYKGNGIPGNPGAAFLRAWKADSAEYLAYQLYIISDYSGNLRIYDSAYDSNGNNLETVKISREINACRNSKCSYIEHIGVNMTEEYINKNKESGIRLKIIGKGGEEIYMVPSEYIKEFLTFAK